MENRIIQTPLLLLAGGASSRMGSPKGLLRIGKRLWLEEQLHRFAFCGSKAVIVLGHDHEKYLEAMPVLKEALQVWAPWPAAEREELQLSVTINSHPELGPFSSLKRGLDRFLSESDIFILPVDVPVPIPNVWRQLELNGHSGHLQACIPEHQGSRGHPVWLSSKFLNRLRSIAPEAADARLDHQIASLGDTERRTVEVSDPKITWNINTPDDFEDLKRRLAQDFVP